MLTISRHQAVGAIRHCLIASCALLALAGCGATRQRPEPIAKTATNPVTAPVVPAHMAPTPAPEAAPAASGGSSEHSPQSKESAPSAIPSNKIEEKPQEIAPAAAAENAKPAKEKTPAATPVASATSPAEATRPATATPAAKPAADPANPASSQILTGTVTLLGGGKEITDPADMADTVVYFVPEGGAPHPTPTRFRIYTHGKQFEPSTLVVPLGSTISFPNLDTILHNVFSVSPGASFDLGLLAEGKSGEYTFTKGGTAFINCNVHQLMQANVLVVDTPYVTHPNNSGNFKLAGLPSGPGKVWTWNPRANTQALAVTLPATNGVELRVVLVRPRQVQHLNKENKPY